MDYKMPEEEEKEKEMDYNMAESLLGFQFEVDAAN